MLQSSAIFVRTASSSETVLYLPAKFKEDRVSVLHDAIRQAGIATLVTLGPDGHIARHLPVRSAERRVGKECVIRVEFGGRRIIKKKKKYSTEYPMTRKYQRVNIQLA